MPAFTVGYGFARAIAAGCRCPLRLTTHQEGHIAAVLYAANRMELLRERCYALHLSGGTTEILLCDGTGAKRRIEIVGKTLDVSAGQLVDRLGVYCGLSFPCGAELEKMAPAHGSVKAVSAAKGPDCNFSGLENQCKKLVDDGEEAGGAARFLFDSIARTLCDMVSAVQQSFGEAPLILCGGVLSNRGIKEALSAQFSTVSAEPCFSADNASGVAALALL